jgi:surface antigen
MKALLCRLLVTAILLILLGVSATVNAQDITGNKFDNWTHLPEYTVFNRDVLYKGQNCTWYAYGRMLQMGYSPEALDVIYGMAGDWADKAAKVAILSTTPGVGSIAFWERGARGASIYGHVAVVEAINQDGSITISESNYGGPAFRVRSVSKALNNWPTSFISVPPSRPKSQTFSAGLNAKTTAGNVIFSAEGKASAITRLPKGTVVRILEHVSNGIYASRPVITTYHHFWYVELLIGPELKRGWVAEDYLEAIRPVPPVLLSPANGSKLNSATVEFKWQPSAGATRYYIEILRLQDQEVVFRQALGDVHSFQYHYYPKDGNIYAWRVYAGDLHGWGEPSDDYHFANGYISAPRLLSPENQDELQPGRINFHWEQVAGATDYGLLLRRQSDGQLILHKNLGNINSYSHVFPPSDEKYSWQIFAGNKISGWGLASEAWSFDVITGSGGLPVNTSSITLLTPVNRSVIPGNDTMFEWTKPPGASAYYLYLQKVGEDAVTRQAVGNTTRYHYDKLEADGSKYRWMVEARVWLFWTRSSPVWEFVNQKVDTEKREKVLNVCDEWTVANSGGYGITIDRWDISGLPSGTVFDIRFNTFRVPDKIVIEYEGATVYDSGWRGQQSYIDRNPDLYPGGLFGPGKDEARSSFTKRSEDSFTVTVYGPENNTKWNYQMRARCN